MTVPTVTAIYNRNGVTRTNSIKVLLDAVKQSKGAKRERGEKLMTDLIETADGLVAAMCERLKNGGANDDDF